MQRKRITYSLVSTSPGTPPVDALPSLENGKLSALFAKSNLGQVGQYSSRTSIFSAVNQGGFHHFISQDSQRQEITGGKK